ncbi:hypothetical protein ONS95_006081 [Cadophora gregata]|uniref:uncharacterized protein n=1 Tax=Cadophora gregata TaxID=51156 RepID=UPI0026DB81F6|nr:uncharacterized protein ONS95_006081 [Cadophora gregata]KAK0102462.1 hypothetical protein ONS95_006081 [Cadophora gregata]KAK0104090.1 hypothetical protein ONS96_005190 [Cadophora gregata f. sp. sojae]
MSNGVEDFLEEYGRNGRRRAIPGHSLLPFDVPSRPPAGAYRRSSTTIARPTLSNISALSGSSRSGDSDSASRRSSTSTARSTAPSIPLFGTPPWHDQRGMDPNDFDYDLPCEFVMLECGISFPPERYEDWIAHSLSHFLGNDPPSSTVCIFCDDSTAYVHDQNPFRTWRARMIHIGRHHQENRGIVGPRPDHFLIKHLKQCGLIADEDYEHSMSYTERQPCDNLVEYGFQTPEMKERERKNAKPAGGKHDMRREQRQMRQEGAKGIGGRSTYKSSKRSRNPEVYYEPRS